MTRDRAEFLLSAPKGINYTHGVIVIAGIVAIVIASQFDRKSRVEAFLVAFFFLYVTGNLVAEWVNLQIIALKNSARRRQSDYAQFRRFQVAVQQHEREVAAIRERELARQKELDRLAWLQEERWKKLDGWEFEVALSKLLGEKGWSVRRTKGSGDEGVDIVLTARGKTVVVQCKAHGKAIGPGPVRELYGTLHHQRADEAWLVTTSGFSKAAAAFARGKPIRLITIKEILRQSQAASPGAT